jgi:hypothetical protein
MSRLAGIAAGFIVGIALLPAANARTLFRSTHAGVACRPANGALASSFTYTLQTLTNAGTTYAYVICALPMDDVSTYPTQTVLLTMEALLPDAGSTLTCTAQVGAFHNGVSHIRGSLAKSHRSVAANEAPQLFWNSSLLAREVNYEVLSLNCKVPPGATLGLIQREDGEPEIVSSSSR